MKAEDVPGAWGCHLSWTVLLSAFSTALQGSEVRWFPKGSCLPQSLPAGSHRPQSQNQLLLPWSHSLELISANPQTQLHPDTSAQPFLCAHTGTGFCQPGFSVESPCSCFRCSTCEAFRIQESHPGSWQRDATAGGICIKMNPMPARAPDTHSLPWGTSGTQTPFWS